MEQLIHFIMQHPYLWGGAAIIVILLLIFEFEAKSLSIHRVSATELSLLMNRKGVVIDVNEVEDFSRGHILGVIHLPLSQWTQKITSLDKYKSTDLILVSSQERQTIQAAKMLKQKGFERIAILGGGLGAWQNAGLPLVKK